MSTRSTALAVLLLLPLTACGTGNENTATSQVPGLPSPASSADDAFGLEGPLPVPEAGLVTLREGNGSQDLGEVTIDQESTLTFACLRGAGAVLRFGTRTEQCPADNDTRTLNLDAAEAALALSVDAPRAVVWSLKVVRNL